MSIVNRPSDQSNAAHLGLEAAKRLMADPKFVDQLGNKRGEFLRLITELERAVKKYDAEHGIFSDQSNKSLFVMGTVTASFNPYVIAAGFFAAAVIGPSMAQTIQHTQTQRALEIASTKLREFIVSTGSAILKSPLNFAAAAGTINAMLAANQLRQLSLGLLSVATVASGLALDAKLLAVPSTAALTSIRTKMAELIKRMPPQCKDLETEYKSHLGRANNALNLRSGGNLTRIWGSFIDAAAKLVECITGRGGPGGPTPAGS